MSLCIGFIARPPASNSLCTTLPARPCPPIPAADWRQDLMSLCIAMPFMTACTLYSECKVRMRGGLWVGGWVS